MARRGLLAVLLSFAVAIVLFGAGGASGSHPQQQLRFACAANSNGLMHYVTDLSQCKKNEEQVSIWPGPTHLCIKANGSVRKVNSPAQCTTGPPGNQGTPLTVPSGTDAYFCAHATTGALRKVPSPASCTASEIALVVANHNPTDIALSNSSVAENEPSGTTVGTLSATDPDPAATFNFSLVAGAGDTDNASFTIDGTTLKTNAVFDYETKNSYSIRVRVTDGYGGSREEQFTISVTDVVENAPPTDIQLSNQTVAENQPAGTNVGTLTTTDPDVGDTHTYSLVAGPGDDDNAKFQISGSSLQTAQLLDFEADPSLSVRIRTFDGSSGYEESFTITVTNANDAPTDIALSNSSVAENQPAGTTVGTLSATDQDAGATHTFTLVAGTGSDDNAKFQISGSTLQTAQPLDFEADNSLTVRVRADDGAGGTFEKAFTITVTNVNEAPTDIALSNSSVAENEPVGTTVGTLSATDPDAGDTQTFALVAGAGDADNASFQISGSTLQTNAVFDFDTKSSYSIRVQATDSGSLTFQEQFTITITNVNEAPTDISLSNSSVAENQPAGTLVGTFSATDDPGDTHTFTLVAGAGSTDNSSFQIVGSALGTNETFDFETKSSYSIRVRVTDSSSNTFEKQFTITITNANDAPNDIALSNASVNENEGVGTAVGTLSATDQDAGDTHTFTLVSGTGDTDNASFQIDGTTLETNAVFNYEVKNSYSIRVRVTDSGSATHEEQFTISIVDVNDAPVAVADSYGNAVGNTLAVLGTSGSGPRIVLTGNVITNNDTDEDGDSVTAVAETNASTGGGSATINSDGSFTFLPGVGDKNEVDTFPYHVTDGVATSAGVVSVTIANVLVWYVDDSAGAGDGRSNAPFNTLASLNGAGGAGDFDTTGDIIFLYSGTYGGGLPLEGSQKLTGEPHGLTVNPGSGNVTLVDAGGTNPTIGNAGGAGIGLASGVEVQRVNVNGTSGAGVTGSAVTTATIGGNTSIGGTTGNAFELSGAASGTIDVGSTISSSTARSISVQSRTGGSVNLTGNVTDTGQGIFLNSNTGATINLTGSLTVSTGANPGFTATAGGTVNANTASNTIATTTGTALNVQNTLIGASGLVFRSIAANGATNGIVLNNTGASGSLSVTGNGGTCTAANTSGCSGGQIQNLTGADNSTAVPGGTGIVLKDTLAPSLTRMWIHDASNYGIRGTNVAGLTLANSVVNGTNGNNGATPFDDSTVWIDNLTGSASVSDSAFSGGFEDNFRVNNSSGSLDRITFSGVTVGLNSTLGGNDGIALLSSATAGAFKATIQNSTFTGAGSDLLNYIHNGSGAGDLVLNANAFSNNHPLIATGVGGVTLNNNGTSGNTTMSITNNTFRDAVGPGILVVKTTGPSTQTGTFSGNTVGVSGLPNSGSKEGSALKLQTVGLGTVTWSVTSNQIYGYNNFGIEVLAGGSATAQSGAINTTITGNTIAEPGNTAGTITIPKNGVHLNIGTVGGDTYQACAVIGGAGALANLLSTSGADGVPPAGGGQDVRLRQRQSTTIRLPGYGGSATNTAAVESFVAGNNPSGGPSVIASVNSPPGGGFTGTGATCP